MKNLYSDKALLAFGILLLLANLGFQVYRNQVVPTKKAVQMPADSPTQVQDRSPLLLNAALLADYLHWDNTLTVTDENNRRVKFNDILGQEKKLVFRFSELSCSSCLDREIALINEISQRVGAEKVVFIASYNSIRDLMVFKRINKIPFQVYNAAPDQLSADFAGETIVFVASPRSGVIMPFIPDKEDEGLSKLYYQAVATLFEPKISL